MPSSLPVIQRFRGYNPSVDLTPTVEMLLRSVPDGHLAGLKYVALTNSTSTRQLRRGKTWSRSKKVSMSGCLAFYRGDHVELLVDNLLRAAPPWVLRLPISRAAFVGAVLYHEIGHHVHTVHRPAFGEREDIADQYQRERLREFMGRRYWYLTPFRRPLAVLLRALYARKMRDRSRGSGTA